MAQGIEDEKAAQRQKTAPTSAAVRPLRMKPVPPMPPLQHIHGQRAITKVSSSVTAGATQGAAKGSMIYDMPDPMLQRPPLPSHAPVWPLQGHMPPMIGEPSSSWYATGRPGTPHPQLPPPPPQIRLQPPAPTATKPTQPMRSQMQRGQQKDERQQVKSTVRGMTSQMASMKSDLQHVVPGPRQKENFTQASNVMSDRIHPELLTAEPDIDHITVDDSDDDDDEDHVIIQNQHTNVDNITPQSFKANRFSSLQLKTAKALLQKELNELERKTVQDMLLDTRTRTTPYGDHYEEKSNYAPLFVSSYIISTPGCYEIYTCKACNKEVPHRQNFRHHHKSKTHLKNLDNWIQVLEDNNYADQVQNEIRLISTESIMRAKQALFEYMQLHNRGRANFDLQCNSQLNAHNATYAEAPFGEINHPHQGYVVDLPRQINEQDFAAFTKASLAIRHRCPPQFVEFKIELLMLLANIYFDRNECKLQLHFDVNFYDKKRPRRHWIPDLFETIKRQTDPRGFIQHNVNQNDLSFVIREQSQTLEISAISSMARLLFHIFLECHFIPTSYIILLATIMNTTDVMEYDATSVCLNNGMTIDLLLQSGVVVFKPSTAGTAILQAETEPYQDVEVPQSIDQADDEQERIFTSKTAPTTFLPSLNQHVDDDELLNHSRIQDDININKVKNANDTIAMDDLAKNRTIDHSSLLEESNMYQTSCSSFSSTSSIKSIPDDDTEDNTIDDSIDLHDMKDDMDQETEIVHEVYQNTTIYVPNLPNHTTEGMLSQLLAEYGPIQTINMEPHENVNLINASVTFINCHNARSAMSSLNGTLYKDRSLKIVMSKNNSFLSSLNQHNNSPLNNMTRMIQTMSGPSNSPGTEIDPETEERNPTNAPASANVTEKKGYKRKLKGTKDVEKVILKTSKPNLDSILSTEQPKEWNEAQTEFSVQCSMLLPPSPKDLAQSLFQYWEEHLDFYEDIHRTKNCAFIIETINELSILAGQATPYRSQNKDPEAPQSI